MGDLTIKDNNFICSKCNSKLYIQKFSFYAKYNGVNKKVTAYECNNCNSDIFIVTQNTEA